jgi:hypothetical protein
LREDICPRHRHCCHAGHQDQGFQFLRSMFHPASHLLSF